MTHKTARFYWEIKALIFSYSIKTFADNTRKQEQKLQGSVQSLWPRAAEVLALGWL